MLIAFAFIYVMTNLPIQRCYSSGRLPSSDPEKGWKLIFSVPKQPSKIPVSASKVPATTDCLQLSFLCISISMLQEKPSLKRPDYPLTMSNNTFQVLVRAGAAWRNSFGQLEISVQRTPTPLSCESGKKSLSHLIWNWSIVSNRFTISSVKITRNKFWTTQGTNIWSSSSVHTCTSLIGDNTTITVKLTIYNSELQSHLSCQRRLNILSSAVRGRSLVSDAHSDSAHSSTDETVSRNQLWVCKNCSGTKDWILMMKPTSSDVPAAYYVIKGKQRQWHAHQEQLAFLMVIN